MMTNDFSFNTFTFLNLNTSIENLFFYFFFFLLFLATIYWYLKIPKKRWLLLSLRSLLLLGLVFIYLEPALEYVKFNKGRKNVFILKDHSESLKLPLKTKENRAHNLNHFFSKNKELLQKKFREYHTVFYRFGETLTAEPQEQPILATEQKTKLVGALQSFLKTHSIKDIASLVIASDFIDTEQKLSVQIPIIKKLTQQKFPINFILPDIKQNKDIFIEKVEYDSYAFVQNTTSIDVYVKAIGYQNIKKKIELYKNNKLMDTNILHLRNGRTEKITFKFKPERVGNYIYSIKVPVEKDEDLFINNHKDFLINIIRDKIRVVQVVGKPSWDVKFMRQLLKNHPDIDLVSFFILRTTNDVYLVPEKELSLIPFPAHELFYDRLNSFDLIILQNFNYAPYGISPYLKNIKEFVTKRGGGFAMIGGLNSFTAGGYKGTEIEDILPVHLASGGIKENICYKNTPYKVTASGLESPFFRFANNMQKQKKILKNLPSAEGFNKTSLKSDATLIASTNKACDNKTYPLIAISKVKNGRSMAVMTDSQWTWNFHALTDINHKQLYSYFWDKAIKWLIKDPDMKLIKLSFDSDTISKKESLSILVKAYDYQYEPLKDKNLIYQITDIDQNKILLKKTVKLDANGSFQVQEKIEKNGRYKIELKTYLKGRLLESTYHMFLVQDKSEEFNNPQINQAFLKEMAQKKNVHLISYKDSADQLQIKKINSDIVEKKYISIWDNIYLLLLLIFLFLLEVYIKRYKL